MEKTITLKINRNSIDRVQQQTLNEEQWLWLEERVLRKLLRAIQNEFGYKFEFELKDEDADVFVIQLSSNESTPQ